MWMTRPKHFLPRRMPVSCTFFSLKRGNAWIGYCCMLLFNLCAYATRAWKKNTSAHGVHSRQNLSMNIMDGCTNGSEHVDICTVLACECTFLTTNIQSVYNYTNSDKLSTCTPLSTHTHIHKDTHTQLHRNHTHTRTHTHLLCTGCWQRNAGTRNVVNSSPPRAPHAQHPRSDQDPGTSVSHIAALCVPCVEGTSSHCTLARHENLRGGTLKEGLAVERLFLESMLMQTKVTRICKWKPHEILWAHYKARKIV